MKLVHIFLRAILEKVREAVFEAGAGVIGNYDRCGFNAEGTVVSEEMNTLIHLPEKREKFILRKRSDLKQFFFTSKGKCY